MKNNKHLRNIFILLFIIVSSFSEIIGQDASFEKGESFYPFPGRLQKENITWGNLLVPENWEKPDGTTIKIAVAVLKNTSGNKGADAVVFIQGGPGAGGVQNIGTWLDHPLRKMNDIVLFDVRGTGFSEPRLCPDLGKKFLEILAKNQSEQEDEKQKTAAALSCKQDLINREINIDAYHSLAVAKDINALKSQLGYPTWNVYGISYGTYMAQVYASNYPKDIKTLLLDSSIDDITTYYTKNTDNYMGSLLKVFNKCRGKADCNAIYPDLENSYYEVIKDLEENPITVSVDKGLVDSGEFTFNAEDFKVAVQQALYNKQLVEVIPLLIYQFKDRNVDALGNLVPAFSSLLGLDYGVYYCVSCNETLPNNDISDYEKNASKYKRLGGGISFYKSDFKVCDAWNANRKDSVMYYDMASLSDLQVPVLVLSGEFDPITPIANGEKVAQKFKNAHNIKGFTYGHVPGFTRKGNQVTEKFINNPDQKPDMNAFKEVPKLNLVSGVTINSGISKMGKSLNQLDIMLIAPLILGLLIMVVFALIYLIKLLKGKYGTTSDRMIRSLSIVTSIIGIVGLISLVLALLKVSGQNYFVIAFGLPDHFDYIFTVILIFVGLLIVTLMYFMIQIKNINNRSIVFTVLFSNVLLATYLFYWGVI